MTGVLTVFSFNSLPDNKPFVNSGWLHAQMLAERTLRLRHDAKGRTSNIEQSHLLNRSGEPIFASPRASCFGTNCVDGGN